MSMNSFLIIASNNQGKKDFNKFEDVYTNNPLGLEAYYLNLQNNLDCKSLNFPEYSNIIVYANLLLQREINFCSEKFDTETFLKLVSENKPHNFELFYYNDFNISGAIDPILPDYSNLILFSTKDRMILSLLLDKLKNKIPKIGVNNPFVKFAHYIYLMPDVAVFSLSLGNSSKLVFSTSESFESIKDFSNEALTEWRKEELERFINWSKAIIPTSLNQHRLTELNQFFDEYKNIELKSKALSNQYEVTNYKQEILIIETILGNIDKVNKLIASSVNINFETIYGSKLLHIAIYRDHYKIVESLIKGGADINSQIKCPEYVRETATYIEINKYHNSIEGLLFKVRSYIYSQINYDYNTLTPFILAAYKGNPKIVTALIEAGADINRKTYSGITALDIAESKGHNETLKVLIKAGANINLKTCDDRTKALDIAESKGHNETVKALIKGVVESNDRDKSFIHYLFSKEDFKYADLVPTFHKDCVDFKTIFCIDNAGNVVSKLGINILTNLDNLI